MTTKTRRRVLLALVVLALTLPAETILLRAITQADADSARQWAQSLSETQVVNAGDQIRGYSYLYRRELMRRAKPEQRVRFWQGHIGAYVDAHPELDGTQRDVLQTALAAVTVENLEAATPEIQAAMGALGDQVAQVLGRDEAAYLLIWLGARETSPMASLDPLLNRLASVVRSHFVADAFEETPCDCQPEFGCWSDTDVCDGQGQCLVDSDWPKCGWWWNQDCTHLCVPQEW